MGLLDLDKHPLHRSVTNSLTPDRPPRPEYESELFQVARNARSIGTMYIPMLRQRMSGLVDTSSQLRRVGGNTSADIAQQSVFGATPFQRAVARMGALSKIGLQGELQIRQQALRDRFAMARLGNNVRLGIASDLSNLAGNQAEQNAAIMRAQQQQNAAMANMSGAVIGGVASAVNNLRSNNSRSNPPPTWT